MRFHQNWLIFAKIAKFNLTALLLFCFFFQMYENFLADFEHRWGKELEIVECLADWKPQYFEFFSAFYAMFYCKVKIARKLCSFLLSQNKHAFSHGNCFVCCKGNERCCILLVKSHFLYVIGWLLFLILHPNNIWTSVIN